MTKIRNLKGQRFGRLFVLKRWPLNTPSNKAIWTVRCDCGVTKQVVGANLISGYARSCGCLFHEELYSRNYKHGHSFRDKETPEYRSWMSMHNRCRNTKEQYKPWNGRGITVCKRWSKFENFYNDMGPRPKNTTLDRIDNNGNYEPSNCRWATVKEQNANKTNNKRRN